MLREAVCKNWFPGVKLERWNQMYLSTKPSVQFQSSVAKPAQHVDICTMTALLIQPIMYLWLVPDCALLIFEDHHHPSITSSRIQPSSWGTNIHRQPVICHTIAIIVHTAGRKKEIVVENTVSGLNVFGTLFYPTKSPYPLGASPLYL